MNGLEGEGGEEVTSNGVLERRERRERRGS